jgi:hypothetical protein
MSKKRAQPPRLMTTISDSEYTGFALVRLEVAVAVANRAVLTGSCDCFRDFWPEASLLDPCSGRLFGIRGGATLIFLMSFVAEGFLLELIFNVMFL